jgi:hypothetical protein
LGSSNLPSSDFDLFGAVTNHFSNAKKPRKWAHPITAIEEMTNGPENQESI